MYFPVVGKWLKIRHIARVLPTVVSGERKKGEREGDFKVSDSLLCEFLEP